MFNSKIKRAKSKKKFEKSLTEQSHKKGTDINYLVNRYTTSNQPLPSINPEDFKDSTAISFHEAMNMVTNAQQQFEQLPSETRNRFNNDPGQFIDAVNNAEQLAEMQKNKEIGSVEAPQTTDEGGASQEDSKEETE